jgi:hypothetical protein
MASWDEDGLHTQDPERPRPFQGGWKDGPSQGVGAQGAPASLVARASGEATMMSLSYMFANSLRGQSQVRVELGLG